MASIVVPKGRRSTWMGEGEYTVRWRNRRDPDTGTVRQRKLKRGFGSRKEAEALCGIIEAEITIHGFWWPPEWGRGDARPAAEDVSVPKLIAGYCVARRERGLAAHTLKKDEEVASILTRWLDASDRSNATAAGLLVKSEIEAWARWLKATPNKHGQEKGAGTRKRYVGWLLGAWAWALHEPEFRGGVPSPVISLRHLTLERPAPHAPVVAPTWAEMDAMIACASGWQQQLYILLRCTGLRVAQGMALRWSDFDLERGVLKIRKGLPGSKTNAERRGRRIPFAPALEPFLHRWKAQGTEEWVIPTGRRGADARTARARDARRAWDRAVARFGVRGDATKAHHIFRAGFQSGLKKLGADDEAVEQLVGHDLGVRGESYIDPTALPMVEAANLVPDVDIAPSRERVVASSSSTVRRRAPPTLKLVG